MKTALLRLCRTYDPTSIVEDDTTERTQYETKALQRIAKGAEVWVDHDEDQVVGRVRDLMVLRSDFDSNGRELRWHCATVDGDFPEWVQRGTGVSIGWANLHSYNVGAVEIVTRGILTEVSLLTPGNRPRNRGAQVVYVKPYETSTPIARRAAAPKPTGDRFLSSIELATFIEIAKTSPVEDLARLLRTSGERTSPDPYLGERGF